MLSHDNILYVLQYQFNQCIVFHHMDMPEFTQSINLLGLDY